MSAATLNRHGLELVTGHTYRVPRYSSSTDSAALVAVLEAVDSAGELVTLRVLTDNGERGHAAGELVTVHRNQLRPLECVHPAACGQCGAVRPTIETYTDSDNRWHAIVTMTRTPAANTDAAFARIHARTAIHEAKGHKAGRGRAPRLELMPYTGTKFYQTLAYGDTVIHHYQEVSA